MKKLLVCQHVAHEILGTLNPLFKNAGFRIRYVNFERHPESQPTIDGYHGLVVLGGPMGVYDREHHPHLGVEIELIQRAIEKGVPVLGICLGAQLIAAALGARVGPNCEKEIGWYDVNITREARQDPLLSHFEIPERIFQWHGDTFEIPPGGVHLASSTGCPNQAFRYGDNVYGFQFHLEVDQPLIERWLRVPANRREIELLNGSIDDARIQRESAQHLQRLHVLSERTFGAFVALFGPHQKRRALPSR